MVKRDVSDDVNTRRELPRNDEHIGLEGIRLAWLGSESIHPQSIAQTSDRAGDLRCKLRCRCKDAFE